MRIIKLLKEHWILAALLLIAAFLRLYRIADYLTFLGDEGRDVLVMKHIIEGFQALFTGNLVLAADLLTLLGPTSSVGGFFLGPFYYYFTAPSLFLSRLDPVGPASMVALVGVATVGLVYYVGNDFFGKKAALVASGLYAISPLVVQYSRSSWNPNVMPFFTLLLMYVLYKAVAGKSWKLFFASGILYGIVMQLHYIGIFLAPIIVVYISLSQYFFQANSSWILMVKKSLKNILILGVGFLLSISPFLLFEIRHNFLNIQNITTFIFASKEVSGNSNFFSIIGTVLFRFYVRLVGSFPPGEKLTGFDPAVLAVWGLSSMVLFLLTLYFFGKECKDSWKKDTVKRYQYLLLSVWFVLGIFFFGFYQKPIYDYYFAFLFPVPFLLTGFFLSKLMEKGKNYTLFTTILLTVLSALALGGMPFQKAANQQLKQARLISEFILDKTNNKPFNFAIITAGNSDHAYRYFFEINNKPAVVIEYPGKDPERKSVTDQLFVVCESVPCGPLGHSVWEVAGFGRAEIAGEWDVSVVKVYKLVKYEGEE